VARRFLTITIREIMLVTVIVALSASWFLDHWAMATKMTRMKSQRNGNSIGGGSEVGPVRPLSPISPNDTFSGFIDDPPKQSRP
jgi:hypothetical protein